MIDLRVIAVGSPFAGDDLAWQVSDKLQQQFDTIEFIKLDRPGSQLIEYLQNTSAVVVMDALKERMVEGVIELTLPQLQEEASMVSSHGFGIAESLQLAEVMQALPAELHIVGLSPLCEITILADKCSALLKQVLASKEQDQEVCDAV